MVRENSPSCGATAIAETKREEKSGEYSNCGQAYVSNLCWYGRLSDDVEDPAKPNTQRAYRGPLRKARTRDSGGRHEWDRKWAKWAAASFQIRPVWENRPTESFRPNAPKHVPDRGCSWWSKAPEGSKSARGLYGSTSAKKRSDFSAGNSVNSGAVRKAAANAGRVDEKRKDFAAILQEGAPGLLFIPPGDAPGTLRPLFFYD